MSVETLYVALPFGRTAQGHLIPHEARRCATREHAEAEASTLGTQFCGAVAFERSVDPMSGAGAAQLIHAVGDVPRLDYLLGGGV